MSRRWARHIARRLVYPVVEAANLGFLLLRKRLVSSGRPRPIHFSGGQRILVVATHPDDETIGCFGAIVGHLKAGDSVMIVMVTDGSGSRAGGLGPEAMAAQRVREVAAVRNLLPNAEIEEWRYPESDWEEDAFAQKLETCIATLSPDIIYSPSCVDFHPEHLKVARTVARVLRDQAPQTTVRAYEMQVPLGPELVNVYLPLDSPTSRLKSRAIGLYRSQRGALDLWKREARYSGALYSGGGLGEGYWELSSAKFARVMEFGSWGWPDTPFRSLDGRPLRDLQAYLQGGAVRRRLRSIVSTSDEVRNPEAYPV